MVLICPNCQAVWGANEIDWQECSHCCYPDPEDENDYLDFENYEDD